MNTQEALVKEVKRNQELLKEYEKIPTGAFGAAMIRLGLDRAYHALARGDAVEMLKAYEAIKDNE
jgi:hypothetical protein